MLAFDGAAKVYFLPARAPLHRVRALNCYRLDPRGGNPLEGADIKPGTLTQKVKVLTTTSGT